MATAPTAVPLYPQVDIPADQGLDDLPKLFDGEWVWSTYCRQFNDSAAAPELIRVRQFSHSPGRQAVASYSVEWNVDEYLPAESFTVKIAKGKPVESFRYPEDAELPGLPEAAGPETATRLINKYVLAMPVRRIRVGLVRYRPGARAVLVHRVGKVSFYVRVVQPATLAPLLDAAELIGQSKFVAPRVAGCWAEGGVLWLSKIPGSNMRDYIRRGNPLDPTALLDRLESLWTLPYRTVSSRPFNLGRAYDRAKRTFSYVADHHEPIRRLLDYATRDLDKFIQSWQPSVMAHNDFYDDQMIVLPDGNIALVDFEEIGPGDPMLDVGNFLAHLRWASRFGREEEAETSDVYHDLFTRAALERFRWTEQELAIREAICLFRTCTNTLRHIETDWDRRLNAGLELVNETLG